MLEKKIYFMDFIQAALETKKVFVTETNTAVNTAEGLSSAVHIEYSVNTPDKKFSIEETILQSSFKEYNQATSLITYIKHLNIPIEYTRCSNAI